MFGAKKTGGHDTGGRGHPGAMDGQRIGGGGGGRVVVGGRGWGGGKRLGQAGPPLPRRAQSFGQSGEHVYVAVA